MDELKLVIDGLDSPPGPAFQEAMRPVLQQHLLACTPAAWEYLAQLWPSCSTGWIAQLGDVLSPAKHGKAATNILRNIALYGPESCLPAVTDKLIAHQCLDDAVRQLLLQRLQAVATPTGHHAAQLHRARIARLAATDASTSQTSPPIQEACEYATDHRAALAASDLAACYYCQTVFPTATISEYIDDEQTALCPHCGTNAVLAAASGYDFSAAGLQALNEFWFI